jgi:DNA-binding protein
MAEPVSKEELVEKIYEVVTKAQGKKQLKAGDITKLMIKEYGDRVTKNDVKYAIKDLIDNARCVYTYFGGSFIEIPHEEGAAKH